MKIKLNGTVSEMLNEVVFVHLLMEETQSHSLKPIFL